MELQSLLNSMKWETSVIDHRLTTELEAKNPLVSAPLSHLLGTTGKKLRAVLIAATARLGSYDPEQLVRAATAVEILHLASLVHDDILDNSAIRRGIDTLNYRWGPDTALLIGDFLYARCFALLHPLGAEVMSILLDTIMDMVEGELRQQAHRKNLDISLEEYLAIIRGKTASFISACCRIGGLVGGLPAESMVYLHQYGENLGIAFQLRDDILDYVKPLDTGDKPGGNDLRQGIVTLPLLLYLQECTPAARAELEHLLINTVDPDPQEVVYLCSRVRNSGVLAHCIEWFDTYLSQALSCLDFLPPAPYLHQIAHSLRLDKTYPGK